jgi:deoxyribodipyrimidine photo-lyase
MAAARVPVALVWLRRDLRLEDNTAVQGALDCADRVALCFVFDDEILEPLRRLGIREDRRVAFILDALAEIDRDLRARGSALLVERGRPVECIPRIAAAIGACEVHANEDYEPAAVRRDRDVAAALERRGVRFRLYKDQVVVGPTDLLAASGKPYTVFTPYKKAWLHRVRRDDVRPREYDLASARLLPVREASSLPELSALGFERPSGWDAEYAGSRAARRRFRAFLREKIDRYNRTRDYPALDGTSRLSVHLRFGTISVRRLVYAALERLAGGSTGAEVWLSELIWREFFMQILAHHPHVVERSFKPQYDRIRWSDDEELFAAWCEGRTGYPLVDAGMRQLNRTGYMHNRLRMVTASFLTKHLGIDWRRGERYFALRLDDYDMAANNGGWQWAASTGCDAQPYFRIFNPVAQSRRFDPEGRFIRRYVPELARLPDDAIHAPWAAPPLVVAEAGVILGRDYPLPVVDHAEARERALLMFRRATHV